MNTSWRRSSLACLFGAAAAFAANAAGAEEFSWHLSGGMSRTEVEAFDWDAWSVDATYFLNPVDDTAGPYALASFLDPTTRVSAAASHGESLSGGEPSTYELRGTYVLPGERWYVGGSYAKTEAIDFLPVVRRSGPKDYGAFAGRYLGSNTTLGVRLSRSELSTENSGCFISQCIPHSADTTADSIGIEAFHVRRFRSLTYSLQGRVSYSDTDEEITLFPPAAAPFAVSGDRGSTRVYSMAAELFPTQRLGVRVGYSQVDDNSFVDSDGYDLSTTWFFKPRIAVQLSIGRTKLDAPAFEERDSTVVRFIGRL